MPEHKVLLYEYYKEKQKNPMPEMDDQMLFVYEAVINEALFNGYQVKVTYYDVVCSDIKSCKDHVQRIDYFDRCIKLIERRDNIEKIPFKQIISVEIISDL